MHALITSTHLLLIKAEVVIILLLFDLFLRLRSQFYSNLIDLTLHFLILPAGFLFLVFRDKIIDLYLRLTIDSIQVLLSILLILNLALQVTDD